MIAFADRFFDGVADEQGAGREFFEVRIKAAKIVVSARVRGKGVEDGNGDAIELGRIEAQHPGMGHAARYFQMEVAEGNIV